MTTLNKPTPHPHAELLKEWLEDTSREIQVMATSPKVWIPSGFNNTHTLGDLSATLEYRLKPLPPKTLNINGFDFLKPSPIADQNHLEVMVKVSLHKGGFSETRTFYQPNEEEARRMLVALTKGCTGETK